MQTSDQAGEKLNNLPTAEHFLSSTSMLNKQLFPKKTADFDQAVDRMKEFAAMHVKAAVKEIQEHVFHDVENRLG
jgi:predicted KAP-like P-loop ATPase